MKTLREILSGSFTYSNLWAVYTALDADGHFNADMPARFGQVLFENGGLNDNYVYFANNIKIVDFLDDWNDSQPSDGIDDLIQYGIIGLYIV